MGENAMKTTNGDDIVFAWSEEDCRALGIERRDAILAWKVLQERISERVSSADLLLYGYEPGTEFDNIILHPNYMRAMRVMLAQWLNVVAVPVAVRTQMTIAQSTKAPEAVRIKAAKYLIDHAEQALERFRVEYGKPVDELDPDALQRVIKYLEGLKGSGETVLASIDDRRAIDVQSFVQPASADAYLADLL